jgi:hypothetical protein
MDAHVPQRAPLAGLRGYSKSLPGIPSEALSVAERRNSLRTPRLQVWLYGEPPAGVAGLELRRRATLAAQSGNPADLLPDRVLAIIPALSPPAIFMVAVTSPRTPAHAC